VNQNDFEEDHFEFVGVFDFLEVEDVFVDFFGEVEEFFVGFEVVEHLEEVFVARQFMFFDDHVVQVDFAVQNDVNVVGVVVFVVDDVVFFEEEKFNEGGENHEHFFVVEFFDAVFLEFLLELRRLQKVLYRDDFFGRTDVQRFFQNFYVVFEGIVFFVDVDEIE
jgi:hypothetical protein